MSQRPGLPARGGDAIAVVILVAAVTLLGLKWSDSPVWTPDALFYRVKTLEITGEPESRALERVWEGELSARFAAVDARRPEGAQALGDPAWVPHSYEFFSRRLVVPTMAAALDPLAGEDGLVIVNLLGSFAFALLLYALLRTRFDPLASSIAVLFVLAWPPLRWLFMPLTESWGLTLLALGLLAALFALERGPRWLWLWAAAVLALGFTRDLTPILLGGAGLAVLLYRSRESLALLGTGVLAALPAPLVGGAPLREHIAYTYSGNRIPDDASWGFVLDRYPDQIEDMLRGGLEYLVDSEPPYMEEYVGWLFVLTLPLLAGLAILAFVRSSRPDPFLTLMRGSVLGAVGYLFLLPHFSYFRYELVLLPAAAAGIAIGVEIARSRWRGSRAPPPEAAEGGR